MASRHSKGGGKRHAKSEQVNAGRFAEVLTIDLSGDLSGTAEDRPPRGRVLRFGSVQVTSLAPDPQVYSANVASGQAALKRAKGAFTKPGVRLHHARNVPVFVADAQDPSVLLRRINGREQRVRLVDGAFVPAE